MAKYTFDQKKQEARISVKCLPEGSFQYVYLVDAMNYIALGMNFFDTECMSAWGIKGEACKFSIMTLEFMAVFSAALQLLTRVT